MPLPPGGGGLHAHPQQVHPQPMHQTTTLAHSVNQAWWIYKTTPTAADFFELQQTLPRHEHGHLAVLLTARLPPWNPTREVAALRPSYPATQSH
eukprot:COSAG01_NODE_39039_length_481_cov_9.471204_1_plen_93_part_10